MDHCHQGWRLSLKFQAKLAHSRRSLQSSLTSLSRFLEGKWNLCLCEELQTFLCLCPTEGVFLVWPCFWRMLIIFSSLKVSSIHLPLTSGHLSWIQVGCQGSLGHIGVLEPGTTGLEVQCPWLPRPPVAEQLSPRVFQCFSSVGPGLPGEELAAPSVDPVPSRQTILNLRKKRNNAKNNLLGTKS